MRITTADTLLQEELKDIYDFEKRLVRAIPKMAKSASSEELRSALMEHLEVTRTQVQRIEEAFKLLDLSPKGKPCNGMKGIIAEGEETLAEEMEDSLKDAAIAGAAQRVEHYEMAAYASAHAIAEHLGNRDVAELLQQTWDEEREADEKLSEIAAQMLEMSRNDGEADGAGQDRETNGRSGRSAKPKSRTANR
jgi:ferritin-like metal-binding protein YciE